MDGVGRVKGKDLPDPLTGSGQKIGEPVSFLPQVSHAETGGQGKQGKQDAASPQGIHLFTS